MTHTPHVTTIQPFRPTGDPASWDRPALLMLAGEPGVGRDAAGRLWRAHAPRAFRGLLDAATPDSGTAGFTFDPDAQRYAAPHGRTVSPAALDAAFATFLTAVAWEFERHAAAVATGAVPIGEWQAYMALALRALYVAAAAVGVGGLARLTEADLAAIRGTLPAWASASPTDPAATLSRAGDAAGLIAHTAASAVGDLGTGLLAALARLGRFARQLAGRTVRSLTGNGDAPPPATVAAVVRRAGLYADSAHGVRVAAERASHARAGFGFERSVLGPAESHCRTVRAPGGGRTEGCDECADAGWVPIGTLPPPGLRTCGPACRCRMEYARQVTGGERVATLSLAGAGGYWRMVEDGDGEGYHRVFFSGEPGSGKPANPPWLNPAVVGKRAAAKNQKAHVAKHGQLPAGTTQHPPAKPTGHISVTPKAKAKLAKHGVGPEQLVEHAGEADSHHIGSSKGKHGEGTTLHVTGVKNGKPLYAKSVGPGHKVWHEGSAATVPPGTDDDLTTVIPAANTAPHEHAEGDPQEAKDGPFDTGAAAPTVGPASHVADVGHTAPAGLPVVTAPADYHVAADPGLSGDGHDAHGQWGKYGAAGVLIRHADHDGTERFLIVQRGPGTTHHKGKWQLPGGALNSNETPNQGAARELTEELSPPAGFLDGLSHAGAVEQHGKGGWKYTNLAADSPVQFDPKVDGTETGAAKWVTKAELHALPLHPKLKEEIDELVGQFAKPAPSLTVSPGAEKALAGIGLTPADVFKASTAGGHTLHSISVTPKGDFELAGSPLGASYETKGTHTPAELKAVVEKHLGLAPPTPPDASDPAVTPHAPQSTLPVAGVTVYGDTAADLAEHGLTPEQVVDHFAAPGSKLTYASVKTYPQPAGAAPKASVSWTPAGGAKQHVSKANIAALPKSITPVPKPAAPGKTPAKAVQLKVHPDPVAPAAGEVAAQVATAAAAPRPDGFPPTAHDLTVVRQLGGSTGAELVEDAAGNRFVRKAGASPAHLINEYHAERAYRAAGVAVPDSAVYDAPSGPLKLSRFVEGTELGKLSGGRLAAAHAELAKGFAADALMANYDVLGASKDNVLVSPDGKVWRVDVGGSMAQRAQGQAMKTGDQWNAHPTELWSMRQPGVGQMADVMAGRSWSDVAQQAVQLATKRDAILASLPQADRAVMAGRLDAMGKVAKTTATFTADKYRESYADTFCKHQVGLAKAGIVERLPKSLAPAPGDPTKVVDQNGKPFDDLRGANSTVAHLAAYVNQAGGDYDHVSDLAGSQAGSSWSSNSMVAKVWMAKQAGLDVGSLWWGKSGAKEQAAAAVKAYEHAATPQYLESMAAMHAFTHATLTSVDLPTVDKAAGTIRLVRGEHGFLGHKAMSVGESFTPKRSSLESTGMFKGSLGSNLFAADVPVHRVVGTYMQARYAGGGGGSSGGMFLGDSENEALANINGIKVRYLGPNDGSTKIPAKTFA